MKKHIRIWETAAMLALCTALLLGTWAESRQASLRGSLLRLHVIAASDEEEEQAIKLRVRDAVLAYLGPRLAEAEDREAARVLLAEDLEGVARAAETAAEGRTVRVCLGEERYPLREYGSFRLPAGRYESLRVVLGEGEGRNWWCVVFPPLCLSAAEGERLQSAMSREDYGIVTGEEGYVLRFRLLELWGELTDCIAGRNKVYLPQ